MEEQAQLAELLHQIYDPARIRCFADPLMAVKYGANNEVDALYAPVVMRRLGGFELGKLLRNLQPKISLHFIGNGAQQRTDAMHLMADSFIPRPLTEQGIRQAEEKSW